MNNQNVKAVGLNRFFAKIYAFLAAGIGISAVVSYLVLVPFAYEADKFINNFPLGFMGLWIIEIVLVMVLSAKAQKSPSLAVGGFIAYSILNGVTLAVTLSIYDFGTVTQAFVTTAITFMVMAVVGATTKRDLSGIGRAAISCLIGILIAMFLNIFILQSSAVELFTSILLVLIMSGLTAYDNQMIRKIYAGTNGQANSGVAVFMALSLYLNFVNMFLAFLRIFGNNN